MSNTRTIKIILNLRQLDGGGCNTDCGSKSCGGDAAAATCCKEDPQKAIDRARELGRNCGGGGGRCGEEKPTCPPPAKVCPPVMDACPPPAKEACPPPAEACPTPPPPPPPPQEKQSCAAKKAAMEPPKQECPKPPEVKKECPKPPEVKKECPKPPEIKKECPKPPEVKKECPKMEIIDPPKKCAPPKYINTDVGPDGKEQQCKQGSSTDGKCRFMGQQRSREDDFPNPASSGGMVQFFKDRFYNASQRW